MLDFEIYIVTLPAICKQTLLNDHTSEFTTGFKF